jgi:hypothetical protein
MRLHQTPVSGLAKRRERNRLLGPLHRLGGISRAEVRIGQSAERAAADLDEFATLLLDPCPLFPRQEWRLQE